MWPAHVAAKWRLADTFASCQMKNQSILGRLQTRGAQVENRALFPPPQAAPPSAPKPHWANPKPLTSGSSRRRRHESLSLGRQRAHCPVCLQPTLTDWPAQSAQQIGPAAGASSRLQVSFTVAPFSFTFNFSPAFALALRPKSNRAGPFSHFLGSCPSTGRPATFHVDASVCAPEVD